MLLRRSFFSLSLLWVLSAAQTPSIDINRYPPQPQSTVCGDIVNNNVYNGEPLFFASEAFDCLTSVPFNDAVALRFLNYLNETFQFHATTAYIRNPPPGYQQPPFDLFGALEDTADRVRAGAYHNQYAFETDVQYIVRNLHDSHAFVYAGVGSLFTFLRYGWPDYTSRCHTILIQDLSPFRLASVSLDGTQAPKLYVYDDLIDQVTTGSYNASAITTINGVDAVDYMITFASEQSFGMVEPHADWNQLMVSPAQEIFGLSSFSDAAPFYAGDNLTLTFENQSTPAVDRWISLFASPGFTGPLETPGDFYNFFVLGLYPASYDIAYAAFVNNQTTENDTQSVPYLMPVDDNVNITQTSWHNDSAAYPSDVMNYQQDLGLYSNGVLTGYYIEEVSTAILSLPSFDQSGDGIDTFSQSVIDFIGNATQRSAQKVIIDLQQNDGGLAPLAFSVFDQFFPNTRPFAGSRMRSQQDGNILGETTTYYFQTLPNDPNNDTVQDYEGDEWVVTDRINALTNTNFTSWAQYYGPLRYNGDNFSLVQRYDLSNPTFVENAFGVDFDACFYTQSCPGTPKWAPADIVILTDGVCGSTCSLFVEMMRKQGVRSVAIGGLPKPGPMQAASGSRGAASYSGEKLWNDISIAGDLSTTAAASLPSSPPDTGIQGTFTGFTLRDQMQRDETTPNQVLYLPASCRLYWTIANFYNYTRLWKDVHDAVFIDPSLCVTGSVDAVAPQLIYNSSQTAASVISDYIAHGLTVSWSDHTHPMNGIYELPGIWDGNIQTANLQFCHNPSTSRQCKSFLPSCFNMHFGCSSTCTDTASCAPASKSPRLFSICSKTCYNKDSNSCGSGDDFHCVETRAIASRNHLVGSGTSRQPTQGYCEPDWSSVNQRKTCSAISQNNLAALITGA